MENNWTKYFDECFSIFKLSEVPKLIIIDNLGKCHTYIPTINEEFITEDNWNNYIVPILNEHDQIHTIMLFLLAWIAPKKGWLGPDKHPKKQKCLIGYLSIKNNNLIQKAVIKNENIFIEHHEIIDFGFEFLPNLWPITQENN